MTQYNWQRIAFTGFAGAGKSEAGRALDTFGYQDVSLGNVGKKYLDPLIQQVFGFSAFTEDRAQKKLIRNTLEWFMEDAFEFLAKEFFASIPGKCAATRVLKVKEAQFWREKGHPLIEILKPGVFAVSDFEQRCLEELHEAGVITHQVVNDGTIDDLHNKILVLLAESQATTLTHSPFFVPAGSKRLPSLRTFA